MHEYVFEKSTSCRCHSFLIVISMFVTIVNGLSPLTIISKLTILDVWGGARCASETGMTHVKEVYSSHNVTCGVLCSFIEIFYIQP